MNKINKLSLAVVLALPTCYVPSIVYADISDYSDSLGDGNEIHWMQFTSPTGNSSLAGSSISVNVSTGGFTPFLAMSHFQGSTSWSVTEVAQGSSNTLSASFTLAESTNPAESILFLSHSPNIVSVGSDPFNLSNWSLNAGQPSPGFESYILTITGLPDQFNFNNQANRLVSGTTAVVSEEDHHESEHIVENVNDVRLTNQITTVRTSYTKNIRSLFKGGAFSIANAEHVISGLNAGGGSSGMAMWFTPTQTNIKNTATVNKGGHFDGSQESYLFGLDFVMGSDMVVGAMIGYETSDTDSNDDSETDTDGYVLSAYMAYNLGNGFAARAHIGYNDSSTDIEDRSTFGGANSYNGDYDSDSVFAGIGVMRTSELDSGLLFTMDLGYDYGDTDSDAYTAYLATAPNNTLRMNSQSSYVSEFNLSTELANPMGWGEVYGALGAIWDLTHTDNSTVRDDGEFGLNAGVGVRFNASDSIQGEVSYNKVFLRKGIDDYTFSANLRFNL